MDKGDIILIPFPFSDLTGTKLRPAVVLINGQADLTVSFITSQMKWAEPTDIQLEPEESNGIKKTSLVRLSKIATLDKKLVIGRIGSLNKKELIELDVNLKKLFQLN